MNETTISKKSIYGSFYLDQIELAIPVSNVEEVVNFPEKVSKMPLSPHYVDGIFNLRGMIIPIINLVKLLELPKETLSTCEQKELKVAIINIENVRFGFTFSATGEIIRSDDSDYSSFNYDEMSRHFAVRGALKLNDGKRLIQILDASSLLIVENLPIIKENIHDQQHVVMGKKKKKCISFTSGNMHFAVDIQEISEVILYSTLNKSALESELCLGMLNLRGNIIPVLDFSKLIEAGTESGKDLSKVSEQNEETFRIIVLRIHQSFFGIMVNSVYSIDSYEAESIIPIPTLTKKRSEMFRGLLELNQEDLFFLSPQSIVTNDEVLAITKGHSKLYSSEYLDEQIDQNKSTDRKSTLETYIVFDLSGYYAVPIFDVIEIIDVGNRIIKSPGSPSCVLGIINIRNEAIVIFDTPSIYKIDQVNYFNCKILILNSSEGKFGFLVISVDNIIKIRGEQKLKGSSLLSQNDSPMMGNMKEIITYTATTNNKDIRTIAVLDVNSVIGNIQKQQKTSTPSPLV